MSTVDIAMINPRSRRCVRCRTRGHFADDEEDFRTERVANQMSHFYPQAGVSSRLTTL